MSVTDSKSEYGKSISATDDEASTAGGGATSQRWTDCWRRSSDNANGMSALDTKLRSISMKTTQWSVGHSLSVPVRVWRRALVVVG